MTRVQDKGQVLIPAKVRRAVGIAPGDEVAVEAQADAVVIRKRQGILEYLEETGGIAMPRRLKGVTDREIRRGAIQSHVGRRRSDR